jgi:hypothetical protein
MWKRMCLGLHACKQLEEVNHSLECKNHRDLEPKKLKKKSFYLKNNIDIYP